MPDETNHTDPDKIKGLAIIAMSSDDSLMETLVLKGGNAIDFIYGNRDRASLDLDYSMESAPSQEEFAGFAERIVGALTRTFEEHGFRAFDIHIEERPSQTTPDVRSFWGGYQVQFKVIELDRHRGLRASVEQMRRQSIPLNRRQWKTFLIDISKHEYCGEKLRKDIAGYQLYVYSPAMLAIEKVRAICQSMKEYDRVVPNPSRKPRAQDFYDFLRLKTQFQLDFTSPENQELFRRIFAVKRVPLQFIELIPAYREYHRDDFKKVIETVRQAGALRDYDYYFDFMLDELLALKPLWDVEPPLS
jgi:hypothetical protein